MRMLRRFGENADPKKVRIFLELKDAEKCKRN